MTQTSSTRLTGPEALAAIRDGALLIDVRSEAGRHKNGEIHGAVVVPKTDVEAFLTTRIARRSAEQKVVIFCGSIKGSEPIIERLTAAGLTGIYDVAGGYADLSGADGLSVIERPQTAS